MICVNQNLSIIKFFNAYCFFNLIIYSAYNQPSNIFSFIFFNLSYYFIFLSVRLIVNISSKMNHQILIVFLIDWNVFGLFLFVFFCFNHIVKITNVDSIFNVDIFDMHFFFYTHDLQVQNFCNKWIASDFFFYLGFLSQPFTNHRTTGEGGGHFFNSSLPCPPASQTLRY